MIELTIADLVLNRPLCIAQTKLEVVLSVLSGRLNIVEANGLSLDPSGLGVQAFDKPDVQAAAQRSQNWSDVGFGVAVLPISGSLVHRTRGLDAMSGLQSYAQIGNDFAALMADPSVQHIVLNIDSPGGSVNGLPDLVDKILAARGVKPVTAIVDDNAYSAAYWIASAAQEIVVSRTGGVGSIGAMAVHTDKSQMNAAAGIKITAVTSGARKALLSPNEPLTDAGMAFLSEEVNRMGAMFIEGVASNMGLSPQVVRDMEAGVFMGPAAVAAGLAHRIAPAADALREIVAQYQPGPNTNLPSAGRTSRRARAMAMQLQVG